MDKEPTNENKPAARRGKKIILLTLLLLVAIIGGLIWLLLPPREPSYNGKRLTYWLQQYQAVQLRDPKDPKVAEAREAIRHIGTDSLPTLLRMLKARDSRVKTIVMDWLDEHDMAHHFVPAEEQNQLALSGFLALGELATNSIPAVIDIYNRASSEAVGIKEAANVALVAMYPAPGVANPYWIVPNERAAWFVETGQMKDNLGDYTNAALAYSEAIKLESTNIQAYLGRAAARMPLRDFSGALADSQKALELNPKEEIATYIAGLCKFSLKDFKGAEADMTTAISRNTNNAEAYNYRGLSRANLRRVDDALADLNKAIELNPRDMTYCRNRAMVESLQKEYELALADVSKSIDQDPKDPIGYALRGRIKSAIKDYEGALSDLDRAVELSPKDPTIYASRAAVKVYVDDFESANVDLEKALALEPKTMTAYIVRGVLKVKQGEDDEALANFEHAVELAPQSPEAITMLGLCQYKAARPAALETCVKALRMKPFASTSDLRAYIWLLRVQSGQDDQKKAANAELEDYLKTLQGAKTNEWEASIARFFSGNLAESNFLSQATTTAKRPSAVRGQVSESYYYAGMKRKLADDQHGAMELFQKCLDVKDDNNLGYMNAGVEMRALKK